LVISAEHFFASSTDTADALLVIEPTAKQISAIRTLTDFTLLNTAYLLAYSVSMR
jgi:hypothetical protein